MLMYLLVLFILSIFSLREASGNYRFSNKEYKIVSIFLILFMGFRENTGCDWDTYKQLFLNITIPKGSSHQLIIDQLMSSHRDLGFGFLNVLISQLGGSYSHVIFISTLLFIFPVLIFCKSLPRPFLALNIAFPYFITVIGMGFIRQGIAISFLMLSIIKLGQSRKFLSLIHI